LQGVRTLHARGRPVLHRDLKPGNVFVGTGQSLKVGDFGMSRYVDLAAAAGALGISAWPLPAALVHARSCMDSHWQAAA
jgi:serine/threonine protein kinase